VARTWTTQMGAKPRGMRQTLKALCRQPCRGGESGAQHLGAFTDVRATGKRQGKGRQSKVQAERQTVEAGEADRVSIRTVKPHKRSQALLSAGRASICPA